MLSAFLRRAVYGSNANNFLSRVVIKCPMSMLVTSHNPFFEENREISRESLSNLVNTYQFPATPDSNIQLNDVIKNVGSVESLDAAEFDVLLMAAIQARDTSAISYLMLQKYKDFDSSHSLLDEKQSAAVLEIVRKSDKLLPSKVIRRALTQQEVPVGRGIKSATTTQCPLMDLTLHDIHEMISFCLERRFYAEALAWFNVIHDVFGPSGMQPNEETFAMIVPAFMQKDKWEESFYLLSEASLLPFEPHSRLKLLASIANAWCDGMGEETVASRSNKWKCSFLLSREYLQTLMEVEFRQMPPTAEVNKVIETLFRTAYSGVDKRRTAGHRLSEHFSVLLSHWETVLAPLLDQCSGHTKSKAKGGRGSAGSMHLLRGDRLGKYIGMMCLQTGAHNHILADVLRAGGVCIDGATHDEVSPVQLARGCCDVLCQRMEGGDVDYALVGLCWSWLVLNDSNALLQLSSLDSLSGDDQNEDTLIAAMLSDLWGQCFPAGPGGSVPEEEALGLLLESCVGVLGREQELGSAQISVYMAGSLCRSLLEGASPLVAAGLLTDQAVSDMCTVFQCNNDGVGTELLLQYLLTTAPIQLQGDVDSGAEVDATVAPRGLITESTMLQLSHTLLQTHRFSRLFALFQKFSDQNSVLPAVAGAGAGASASIAQSQYRRTAGKQKDMSDLTASIAGQQPLPVKLRTAPSYVLSSCNSYVPLFQSLITLKQHGLMIDLLMNDMVGKRGIQPSPEVLFMVLHELHRAEGFERKIVDIFNWAYSLNKPNEGPNLLSQRNYIWNFQWFRSSIPVYEVASLLLQSCLLTKNRDGAVNAWLLYIGGIIESVHYNAVNRNDTTNGVVVSGSADGTGSASVSTTDASSRSATWKKPPHAAHTTTLLARNKHALVFTPDELKKISDSHELATYMCMSLVTSTRPCGKFSFSRAYYGPDAQWISLGGIMRSMKANLWSDAQQKFLVEKVVAMAMVTASRERDANLGAKWLNHIVNDDLYFGKCRVNDARLTQSILFAVRDLGGNFNAIMDVCAKVIENNVVTSVYDVIPKVSNDTHPALRLEKYWFDKIKAASIKPGCGCALTECMGEHQSEQLLKYVQKVEYMLRHGEEV